MCGCQRGAHEGRDSADDRAGKHSCGSLPDQGPRPGSGHRHARLREGPSNRRRERFLRDRADHSSLSRPRPDEGRRASGRPLRPGRHGRRGRDDLEGARHSVGAEGRADPAGQERRSRRQREGRRREIHRERESRDRAGEAGSQGGLDGRRCLRAEYSHHHGRHDSAHIGERQDRSGSPPRRQDRVDGLLRAERRGHHLAGAHARQGGREVPRRR
jgi:hypothetical protein